MEQGTQTLAFKSSNQEASHSYSKATLTLCAEELKCLHGALYPCHSLVEMLTYNIYTLQTYKLICKALASHKFSLLHHLMILNL